MNPCCGYTTLAQSLREDVQNSRRLGPVLSRKVYYAIHGCTDGNALVSELLDGQVQSGSMSGGAASTSARASSRGRL